MFFKSKTITSGGKPFIKRLSLYLPKGSIKLHLLLDDDKDDDFSGGHTHPWDFTSFILFGGYEEYTLRFSNNPNGQFNTEKFYMFSLNRKKAEVKHKIKLFRLFGFKIPCITIGYYSDKKQLCSLCQELGYCRSNKEKIEFHGLSKTS